MIRPFCQSAAVKCRGYSQPLQRAITDFGADVTFARLPEKLQEHYGIQVPISSARVITEKHGASMLASQQLQTDLTQSRGMAQLIAEIDGTMIPVVEISAAGPNPDQSDGRKRRQVGWKEARLCLVRPQGSVTAHFAATLGLPEQAGAQLLDCAIRAGAGSQTQLHCLGDGATWIVEQVTLQFGTQARYLVDFSHLCEYLAAAAQGCGGPDKQAWLQQHQQLMKENRSDQVLDDLAPYLERGTASGSATPVLACYRYIDNRPGQFDYQRALAASLPIGSGEIESAHRYVIQERLKRAGAWWRLDNADKMLALRVLRANGDWANYWHKESKHSYQIAA